MFSLFEKSNVIKTCAALVTIVAVANALTAGMCDGKLPEETIARLGGSCEAIIDCTSIMLRFVGNVVNSSLQVEYPTRSDFCMFNIDDVNEFGNVVWHAVWGCVKSNFL